jgi:hypothetical protein
VLDEFPAGGELFSVGASWGSREQEGEIVADVTVASFAEMEPIFDGIARRARARRWA